MFHKHVPHPFASKGEKRAAPAIARALAQAGTLPRTLPSRSAAPRQPNPQSSSLGPSTPPEPACKQPLSRCSRRPSAGTGPSPAGTPQPRPAPQASAQSDGLRPRAREPRIPPGGPTPAGPPCPSSSGRGNEEVLTYLSLLSTPSWIHLSTSPQSIVGKKNHPLPPPPARFSSPSGAEQESWGRRARGRVAGARNPRGRPFLAGGGRVWGEGRGRKR